MGLDPDAIIKESESHTKLPSIQIQKAGQSIKLDQLKQIQAKAQLQKDTSTKNLHESNPFD